MVATLPIRVPDGSAEPPVQLWTDVDPSVLLDRLGVLGRNPPAVLAINGRSGAGKSTLAARLCEVVPGAAMVSTDDVAWHFSMFDWAQVLIEHIVTPVRRGDRVSYRPPGWVERGRAGAIAVEPDRSLLIVEGVGASQRAMAAGLDASIWVQSDADVAFELGLARDVASGANGDRDAALAFWHDWKAAETPFMERDAPWQRADAIIAGTRRSATDQLLMAAQR